MGTRRLEVISIEPVATDVLAFVLGDRRECELPLWGPGAHIALALPNGLVRQYSLCGSPHDRRRWTIAVQRSKVSRGGSRFICEQLRTGSVVDVIGPLNNFGLSAAARYMFIAGGIGITPIVPMIREVCELGAHWRLVYGGRDRGSMAFLSELEAYDSRVDIWPQDRRGLIDVSDVIAGARPESSIYCCGPEGLLKAVEQQCVECGILPNLHIERFLPALKSGGVNEEFEVQLASTGFTLTVGIEETIVDALERIGISVATSCREGVCGTCLTGVLSGIPDHRDSFLTEEEHQANDVMTICCSRASSPRLVLDL